MFSKFCILAAAALVGVGSVASAQAGVVYDSISGNTPSGKYQILSGGGSGPLADSFTTGAQAVYLPSVTLMLDLYTTNPGDLGSIQVTLWSDTGAIPPGRNSLLASFASVADSSLTANAYSLVSVSSTQNITLAANTRYWVQLGSSSASSSWAYGSDSGVGVSGEYHWTANLGVLANSSTSGPFMMQLSTSSSSSTSVPEPSSLLVLGLSLIGLAAARRKAIVG